MERHVLYSIYPIRFKHNFDNKMDTRNQKYISEIRRVFADVTYIPTTLFVYYEWMRYLKCIYTVFVSAFISNVLEYGYLYMQVFISLCDIFFAFLIKMWL